SSKKRAERERKGYMGNQTARRASTGASVKRRWLTVIALGFGHFVDQGEGQAMSTLFPAIRDALGLSYGNLGVIAGIRNILQTLSAPFWGYMADRISRKWIIVFGTGIWGLWTL